MDEKLKEWLKKKLEQEEGKRNRNARGKVSLIKEILIKFG